MGGIDDAITRPRIIAAVCALLPASVGVPELYWLRRSAAEALGRVGGGAVTEELAVALTELLGDEHRQLGSASAFSLPFPLLIAVFP